jgi:hypothetical protein
MKVVFSAPFQEEVIVVRSILASTGIESEFLSEHLLDVYPCFEVTSPGIRLAVADEDAEDAEALVAEYLARRGATD